MGTMYVIIFINFNPYHMSILLLQNLHVVFNVCRMVSTYLVHHGYYNTAEAFAHITDQPFNEDVMSIKNRQSEHR